MSVRCNTPCCWGRLSFPETLNRMYLRPIYPYITPTTPTPTLTGGNQALIPMKSLHNPCGPFIFPCVPFDSPLLVLYLPIQPPHILYNKYPCITLDNSCISPVPCGEPEARGKRLSWNKSDHQKPSESYRLGYVW